MRDACIFQHHPRYAIQSLCRLLGVSPSGYDAWLERPPSQRSRNNDRLLGRIRESYEASGRTYGSPRILCDLREVGECVGKNRIAKIMTASQDPRPARVQAAWRSLPQASGGRPESLAATVFEKPAGSCLGDRHHLYSDRRKVALLGRGDGSLLTPDHRLVHEAYLGQRDCARRSPNGGLATQAQA